MKHVSITVSRTAFLTTGLHSTGKRMKDESGFVGDFYLLPYYGHSCGVHGLERKKMWKTGREIVGERFWG